MHFIRLVSPVRIPIYDRLRTYLFGAFRIFWRTPAGSVGFRLSLLDGLIFKFFYFNLFATPNPGYLIERSAKEPNRTPIVRFGSAIEHNLTHNKIRLIEPSIPERSTIVLNRMFDYRTPVWLIFFCLNINIDKNEVIKNAQILSNNCIFCGYFARRTVSLSLLITSRTKNSRVYWVGR